MNRAMAFIMTLSIALGLVLPVSAATTASEVAQMQTALSGLRVITVILAAICLLVLIYKVI